MKLNLVTRLSPRLVLSVAAGLLFAGHLLPWTAHRTAALTLTGRDLSPFTNLTPGAGIFLNEWFYLPLWVSAVLVALVATAATSRLARGMAGALATAIAALGLPPYPQILTAWTDANYRIQFGVTLVVIVIIVLVVTLLRVDALRRQPRLAAGALALLALSAAVPWAGYFAVRPAIEHLYRDSTALGVGWWLTLAGGLTVLLAAACVLQSPRS
ncbi:MAG: hypothetical protein ACUVR3_08205 [Candidatus Roseilinea sp.]|uniref:hypothetical protein n=1 Tax=Candidatus Roseilinea sp. TaxID=2838777 RepID=UPI004049846D